MTPRLLRLARPLLAVAALTAPFLTTTSTSLPAYAAFPGTNGVIVFVTYIDGTDDLWTATPDGRTFHALTHGAGNDLNPAYSPDGKQVVFLRDGDIWLMHADGSHQHLVRAAGSQTLQYPAFSANGKRIIWNNGNLGIFTCALDGTDKKQIPNLAGIAPVWSPDGRHIAFVGAAGSGTAIFLARPDGTNVRQLTGKPSPTFDYWPDWSPDSKRIVFIHENGSSYDLTVVPLAKPARARTIVPGVGNQAYPVFAPNGESVVYSQSVNSVLHLYRYFFGSQQTAQVGRLTAGEVEPDWQPR